MGLCLLPLEQVPGQSAPLLLSEAGGGAGREGRGARLGAGAQAQGQPLKHATRAPAAPRGAHSSRRGPRPAGKEWGSREAGAEWIRPSGGGGGGGRGAACMHRAQAPGVLQSGGLTAVRRRP